LKYERMSTPAAGGDTLVAEVFDPATHFDRIRPEWQNLADTVTDAAWLSQPEVFRAWTRVIRRDDRIRLIAVHDAAGTLRGVMPISFDLAWRGPSFAPRYDYDPRDRSLIAQKSRRPFPVRQATSMASLPATIVWSGPLCHEADKAAMCEVMAAALVAYGGWSVTVLPADVHAEAENWLAGFRKAGARAHLQQLGRVISDLHHPQPFDRILAGHKWKFRQNVRRARAAAEEAGLGFDILTGRAAVSAELETVARIARASWKQTGREGTDVHLPYSGQQQAFFEELLTSPGLGGEPVLAVASDAQGPCAVLLMMTHGNTVTALLTFWDGRHPKASPGLLLMGRAIDWVVEAGFSHFDFNATAPWVRYFVNREREFCNIVAFSQGPAGRLWATIASLTGRLK